MAIDDAAGEACGIVSVNDQISAPTWTKLGADFDDTVVFFVNAISFGESEGTEPDKP